MTTGQGSYASEMTEIRTAVPCKARKICREYTAWRYRSCERTSGVVSPVDLAQGLRRKPNLKQIVP